MARKEMERTCKRDGTVWFVSLAAAKEKAPNSWQVNGAKLQSLGSQASPGYRGRAGAATQLSQLEAAKARVQATNSCPSCGSAKFSQRKVKI